MNFAEAALLIQGSTCVYSKKVREEKGLAIISSAHCNPQEYMQLAPVGNTTEDGLFRGRVRSLKAKNICIYILYMYIYTLEFGLAATPNTA